MLWLPLGHGHHGPPHCTTYVVHVGGLMERTWEVGRGRSMKPGICNREYGMEYEMEYGNWNMGMEYEMEYGIGIWELEI